MMELQTLQEALKVEIQVHQKLVAQMKQDPQNAELKKQLHELQAKITALSEKQKKVVEQLRKELLVKQEPELKMLTASADSKAVLFTPACPPSQLQTGSSYHQGLPQTVTMTPVITAKTLPLVLKAATSTMPVSMATQRPTVAMVTAISNSPRPGANSDSQSAPINLQVASKLANQDTDGATRIVSKNVIVVQATTTSAQPIKVPQFVPPPRLMPRPTSQPQVRPKPPTPNNVAIAPAPPPPMMAAPLIQRPLMIATKLTSSVPLSAGPVHQVHIVNGQQCTAADKITLTGGMAQVTGGMAQVTGGMAQVTGGMAQVTGGMAQVTGGMAQVTGIVISPALQITNINSDRKTVKPQEGVEQVITSTPPSSPPLPTAPVKIKREERPQKLAFMVSLGLVTHDHLEEIQSKRQERKRRTTANPVYSGAVFEPERKKSAVTYLNTPLHQGTRKRGRPPKYSTTTSSSTELGCSNPLLTPTSSLPASPAPERPDTGDYPLPLHPHSVPQPSPSSGDADVHEDFCTVCRRSGQLLMCDTCSRVYHLDCLDPPLKNIPKGMWICPKCQDQILKKEEVVPWPGTLAIVHSYIAYKEAKEEEKQKLMKWSSELTLEREQLEQRVKQLSNSVTKCMETKNSILARQKEMQSSLDKVKHLIRLIQSFNLSPPMEVDVLQDSKVECTESGSVKDSTQACVQENPAEPSMQENPAEPSVQENPAEPSVQENPAESSVQENPAESSVQENPAEPSVQENPAEPSVQENPAEPSVQENPAEPSVQENPAEPSVQVPVTVTIPELQTEPEVGEMAEPAAAVTPEGVWGQSGVVETPVTTISEIMTDETKAAEPVESPQVTHVKTNGGTDRVCTGLNLEEGVANAADSENIPPNDGSCAENSGKMEVERHEDESNGFNNNNNTCKTSEPSQQALPAALCNVDKPK